MFKRAEITVKLHGDYGDHTFSVVTGSIADATIGQQIGDHVQKAWDLATMGKAKAAQDANADLGAKLNAALTKIAIMETQAAVKVQSAAVGNTIEEEAPKKSRYSRPKNS